jgi:hypothetical protein
VVALVLAQFFPISTAHAKKLRSLSKTEPVKPPCRSNKLKKTVATLYSIGITAKLNDGSILTFRVGLGCKISNADKATATLVDLKLGEDYVFSHVVNEFDTDVGLFDRVRAKTKS